MKPRARRYLAVIIVNFAIIALFELGCAIFIRKHYKRADELFRRSAAVEQTFPISTGYQMKPTGASPRAFTTAAISPDFPR